MRDTAQTPSRSSFPTVVAILGAFLIFYFIINLSYESPERAGLEEAALERPSLAEHQALQADKLSSYVVVDADAGKVRLPIERAKELVVSERSE